MPVPIELILVISGTLASQYLDLNGLNNVIVIGNIPTGLPGKCDILNISVKKF